MRMQLRLPLVAHLAIGLCFLSFGWTVQAAVLIGTNALIPRYDNDNYASIVNNSPGDGQTVTLNPPRFHWLYEPAVTNENNTGIYSYQFQCAYNPTFSSPVVNVRTPFNFYNFIDHFTSSPVYWRIGYVAATNSSVTNWSPARKFYISPNAVVWDRGIFADPDFLAAAGAHPHIGFRATNRVALASYLSTARRGYFDQERDNVLNKWPTNWWWTNMIALGTNYMLSKNGPYYLADACRFGSTIDLPLSGLSTNGIAFDQWLGPWSITNGDKILVKAQNDPSQNGVYVATNGNWYRDPGFSSASTLSNGVCIKVMRGPINESWFKNTGGKLGEAIIWTYALRDADAYDILYPFVDFLPRIAFMWQMTGNPAITNGGYPQQNLEFVCNMIQSNGWTSLDAYGNPSQILFPVAYAYDWLYEVMTPSQRATVLDTLNQFCDFERTNFYQYYWTGSKSVAGGGIMGKKIGSHTTFSQWETMIIGLSAFADSTNIQEFLNLDLNYLFGIGLPFGEEDGPDRGRAYGSGDLPIWIESVSHVYEVFKDQGMTNFPGIKGLADWMVYYWPTGFRKVGDDTWGDGGWGYPSLNQQSDAVKIWAYGDLLARMSACPPAQMSYERATAIWPNRNVVISYPSVTFNFNYPNPPVAAEQTARARVFPNGGWAFGYSRNPNSFEAYSNGVGFVTAARPSGGDNNHTKAADLDVEIWAYGTPVTEGGGYYISSWNEAGGLSRNTCMVNDKFQLSDPWPSRPVKARFTAFAKGSEYVYTSADAAGAYLYTDNVLKAQRHLLFLREKYFVIYDDLGSRTNSTFTWNWQVRPPTLTILSPSSFSYSWTNVSIPGGPAVTTVVAHVAYTNSLGYFRMDRGPNYVDPFWGTISNRVTSNPMTGKMYGNGTMPDGRNHALYFTNVSPATSWHFMTVVYPVKAGDPFPSITPLDNFTVAVTNGIEGDIISFDKNTSFPATLVVDPAATIGRPVRIPPSVPRNINIVQ